MEALKKILPAVGIDQKWVDAIAKACVRFKIDTPKRQAHFAAQMAHESRGFTALSENLNYSAEALPKVFWKRFTAAQAQMYGRTPGHSADWVMIASIAYANRMGNGNVDSMDGWKYRGRGPGGLTGKDNYRACGEALGLDLIGNPDLVSMPEIGALAFGWYWDSLNLNHFADTDEVDTISDFVNIGHKTVVEGDALGYADRLARTNKALEALA